MPSCLCIHSEKTLLAVTWKFADNSRTRHFLRIPIYLVHLFWVYSLPQLMRSDVHDSQCLPPQSWWRIIGRMGRTAPVVQSPVICIVTACYTLAFELGGDYARLSIENRTKIELMVKEMVVRPSAISWLWSCLIVIRRSGWYEKVSPQNIGTVPILTFWPFRRTMNVPA